ncbi:MAG: hypothetical protein CMF29_08515 [Kiritimatiellaceae bacterium]|nr:hypothetical protein [Kiritimatiellaceae bacterium]|tara:strand:- start:410 stop:646 length:237 start_codon:yes stop_codon:yes gene_type:complete
MSRFINVGKTKEEINDMLANAVATLELVKEGEHSDYVNCKDQHHLLETHVNYHATIKEIDNVIELLNKYADLYYEENE